MTPPLSPAELDRLEQLAREATPGQARRMAAGVPLERALSPAVVSELVAAARLGAAWQEAEGVLPEYWRIRSLTETPGKLVGWEVVAAGDQRLVSATGPTPAAALLALAEKLRERP